MSEGRWLDGATDAPKQGFRRALDEAREPTSELRRRRVWARLEPQLRGGTRRRHGWSWRWIAAGLTVAAAGAAAIVVVPAFRRDRTFAPTIATEHAAPPAVEPLPAQTDVELVLSTGAGQRLARTLPSGARVELEPMSEVVVAADGRPELRHGRARFQVPPQPSGRRFVVEARELHVVVVGTRFVVESDPAVGVAVTVEDGLVEIWRDTRIARLQTGDRWSEERAPAHAPAPRPPAARPSPSGPAVDDASSTAALETARAARDDADPTHAIALYERLGAGRGTAAENALYELGTLYRDQLHDPRRAIAAWQRYRTRFPRGLLRAETDLSIVEALSAVGDQPRALAEATAFLSRHPRNERRAEIARVAADLQRASGHCHEAIALYDDALAAGPSAADADDARFSRASCLAAVKAPEAAAALREYLQKHPRGRHVADVRRALAPLAGPTP